jgi:hypothetical protein
MSSSYEQEVVEETTEMLGMRLNLLKGKLAEAEQALPALAADVRKRIAAGVSDAERERLENKAGGACHRIRTMQREYDSLQQRWIRMKQHEGANGNKVEMEQMVIDAVNRQEEEERWEMLDRSGDYFKTRWG